MQSSPNRDAQARADEPFREPGYLRRLRLLVSVLALVLIAAVVTITATIVIRLGDLPGASAPSVAQPIEAGRFEIPPGARVTALGRGGAEVLFVLQLPDGREVLRSYDATNGALLSESRVTREP